MERAAITPGVEYAFREKRTLGTPLQRIRVQEHIRHNKWKAEWINPNPRLVDYVESGQLIVPWKEHKAFLKDEENAKRLDEHNQRCGFECESPIATAMEQVFDSVGERLSLSWGVLSGSPESFERIRARANDRDAIQPGTAYCDRNGVLHWPFDASFELARRFCAEEPSTVLIVIESTERKWSTKADRPGEDYIIPLLNQYRASWALIRQWTGHDPPIAQREAYIEKLQRLVWDAVYALQKAGAEGEAARLRRVLEKR